MRTEIYTRNIYTLEEVKDKAIEKNRDTNLDYDWWQFVYQDAEDIGLKITEFDLDRNRHAKGRLFADEFSIAENIIKNHGELCDTYKLATRFLSEASPLHTWLERVDNSPYDLTSKFNVYDVYQEKQDTLEDLKDNFIKDLLEEYSCILQKEYEYLYSDEAVLETLSCNEYEFDENGVII